MRALVGILSVSEAAAQLRVSPVRVRAMLRDGLVDGQKIGDRWFVDQLSLEHRHGAKAPVGRPLEEVNAWAALFLASDALSQATPTLFREPEPVAAITHSLQG